MKINSRDSVIGENIFWLNKAKQCFSKIQVDDSDETFGMSRERREIVMKGCDKQLQYMGKVLEESKS